MKLLKENLLDLGLGFWHITPKAQATKEKKSINWMPLKKIFCVSNDTIKKKKRIEKRKKIIHKMGE